MGVEEQVGTWVSAALADLARAGALPAEVAGARFSVERPKRPEHGDLATNAALAVQKLAKKPPRDVAALIAAELRKRDGVREVEIAGAGFLNLRLNHAPYHRVLAEVLAAGRGFGHAPAATGERVQVEFVSANPTGPLLVSHGRAAIFGDAVARLLEATGHRVTREYYINDYGNQVRLLSDSVRAILAGTSVPEGGYGGDYVRELAAWVKDNAGAALGDPDPMPLARVCITRMLDGVPGSKVLPGIKQTLRDLGVAFDVFFSEESLHRWGRVDAALAQLARDGFLEARDGALFFRTGDEDDKDRVVRKKDGATTYFASDIAYHADKVARGFDRLLVVLGADHHGYVARVRAALAALGLPADRFEALLFQLVNLLRDGKPYKMGKRLGNLITVEEVVAEIDEAAQRKGAGADALRYFYLARRNDTTIELDIDLAKKASLDNPVFYVQMGHARLCSIQRRARDVFGLSVPASGTGDGSVPPEVSAKLVHPDEIAILGVLGRWPTIVAEAAAAREPHHAVFFVRDLSQAFQSYFTRLKVEGDSILPLSSHVAAEGWEARWDRDKTVARLHWVEAMRCVYRAALDLLGITALERMAPLEKTTSAEPE